MNGNITTFYLDFNKTDFFFLCPSSASKDCHVSISSNTHCNLMLPLIIRNPLQLLFVCGPISRVLKTTTGGAFSRPRHGSQRLLCQITNACSITLTCQKMLVNIAVGSLCWLGSSLRLWGQIGCWPSQSLAVPPQPLFQPRNMPVPPDVVFITLLPAERKKHIRL